MKILMTVMMMLAITSVFADECKLNGECKDEKACKALNNDYAIVNGKCGNPASQVSETKCDEIAGAAGPKKVEDGKATDGTSTTSSVKK